MAEVYWHVVEEIQNGEHRVKIPDPVIHNHRFWQEKVDSAINDRQIAENLFHLLSWTHIQRIIWIVDPEARAWHLPEAVEQFWDVRTLDRNIGTQYRHLCLETLESEGVAQYRYGTHAHGGGGEHGVEEGAAEEVQRSRGDGYSQYIVTEGPEEVLFDVADSSFA
jgi:hypothetical protein